MTTSGSSTSTGALATWKDLCIDAIDRESQARFWAEVTGLDLHISSRNVSLDGPSPEHRVWVNGVDRPHTVKNRVHLDVDCASVEDLVARGARLLEPAGERFAWNVMADPEGNEFCGFVREPGALPDYRLHGIVVDSVDPRAQADWWGRVLDAEVAHDEDHAVHTVLRAGPDDRLTLDFGPVPEPRTVPNRVHWDVVGDVGALLDIGATQLWDEPGWTVLADPEGNEFCVTAAR